MKEISLHALDIIQNSVTAGASELEVRLEEGADGWITLVVADNGRGMTPELLQRVMDPFTTTRTTRKMGLGIPLLRMTAEQTGGTVSIQSAPGVGTTLTARFDGGHIDCPPIGDMASTLSLTLQGAPALEVVYTRRTPAGEFRLDTRELRAILGPQVSLASPEVALWVQEYIQEQEEALSSPGGAGAAPAE